MYKRKYTTKQEREQHIKNFLASGKSQLSWCQENNITPSTFGKWLQDYQTNQQDIKFLPVTPMLSTGHSSNSNEILIEIGVCRLHVPEALGIQFMQQAIKAVNETDVSIQGL